MDTDRLWSDEINALVEAAFDRVSRNPSDHETACAYRMAIADALAAHPTTAEPAVSDVRLTTEQQLKRFGCDLVDLLRREGRHSGVWFGKQLLQAADLIEHYELASLQPNKDGDAVERVARAIWPSIWSNPRTWDEGTDGDRKIASNIALAAITAMSGDAVPTTDGESAWDVAYEALRGCTFISQEHAERARNQVAAVLTGHSVEMGG